MQLVQRTTVTIPTPLWQAVRYAAVAKNTSVSALVRESLEEKIGKHVADRKPRPLLSLAGVLKLGGKMPPTRRALYEKHLSRKMGR